MLERLTATLRRATAWKHLAFIVLVSTMVCATAEVIAEIRVVDDSGQTIVLRAPGYPDSAAFRLERATGCRPTWLGRDTSRAPSAAG